MKKRILVLGVLLIFSILLISPLINATPSSDNAKAKINIVIDNMLGILSPIFEKIIGESKNSSEYFFSKILLLILLTIVITNIIGKTPLGESNKKINFILSAIISILAIRYMNNLNFFEAVLIQYGVLGIAITTILPMVIFFYFIHNTKIKTFGRKVFWTIYAITLTAIWISKSNEIPEVAQWIYLLVISSTVIFIFLDKSIHSYFGLSGFKNFERESNKKRIRDAKKDLNELTEHFRMGRMTSEDYTKETEKLEKYIRKLSKDT